MGLADRLVNVATKDVVVLEVTTHKHLDQKLVLFVVVKETTTIGIAGSVTPKATEISTDTPAANEVEYVKHPCRTCLENDPKAPTLTPEDELAVMPRVG